MSSCLLQPLVAVREFQAVKNFLFGLPETAGRSDVFYYFIILDICNFTEVNASMMFKRPHYLTFIMPTFHPAKSPVILKFSVIY